jgi:hypothetical protein
MPLPSAEPLLSFGGRPPRWCRQEPPLGADSRADGWRAPTAGTRPEIGEKRDTRERRLETCLHARAGISRSRRRVAPCVRSQRSERCARGCCSCPLAAPRFVANGGGRRQVGAARVLHCRGGRSVVAVSVGVAGGVADGSLVASDRAGRGCRSSRSGSDGGPPELSVGFFRPTSWRAAAMNQQ